MVPVLTHVNFSFWVPRIVENLTRPFTQLLCSNQQGVLGLGSYGDRCKVVLGFAIHDSDIFRQDESGL